MVEVILEPSLFDTFPKVLVWIRAASRLLSVNGSSATAALVTTCQVAKKLK